MFKSRWTDHRFIGLLLGPLLAVSILLSAPPEGLPAEAWSVAALSALMAVWWATEAIPLAATALLPLALLPVLGVDDIKGVAETYTNVTVFLLLGGFIIALGLERWNLHRRIALSILLRAGADPVNIVGGFMLVSALTSMWVSNTASTLMMLPIGLSMAAVVAPRHDVDKNHGNFTTALLLGIAYGASIGGIGTLVGSPPNAMVAGYLSEAHGIELGFSTWLLFGLPVVIVVLPLTWLILTRLAFPISLPGNARASRLVRESLDELGGMSTPEYRLMAVFLAVAICWILRPVLEDLPGLAGLSDAGIAILGALVLFVLPSGAGEPLMTWENAKKLPWDVLVLYSGSISLATMVSESGLALWLGEVLVGFTAAPELVMVILLVAAVLALTELLNNSATLAAFLPVIGALAAAGDMNPLVLAIPAAVAASCAFMLPVATPPNTIVFGTGRVSLGSMVRAGLGVNLLTLIIVPLLTYGVLIAFVL